MLRLTISLLLVLASSCACSCASSSASSPSSSSSSSSSAPVTRRDVLDLKEAAEAAHHCSGEEAYDAARGAELEACITSSLQTARALLPRVKAAGAMQPGALAIVRLYIEADLSAAERARLCQQVPGTDDADTLLDDEIKDTCKAPTP